MFPLNGEEVHLELKDLLPEFDSVFSKETGCRKDFKVKMAIDKTASTVFCQVRPVPLHHKGKPGERTGPSRNHGIFQRVEYSQQVATIMLVFKNNNGGIRIYGDYKQTINAAEEQ